MGLLPCNDTPARDIARYTPRRQAKPLRCSPIGRRGAYTAGVPIVKHCG